MMFSQKIGGIAALGHTAALVVGMVLSFTWMFPLLDAAPDQASKFLDGNQALAYLWYMIVNWGSAITLVIMLLALYQRMKAGWPVFMQAAIAFGFLWAVLVRALWILLLVLAAVRTEAFPRLPAYVGQSLGIVGILTLIPAIAEVMFMIFGPGMMVLAAWVGIVMLRRSAANTVQLDKRFMPRHST